MNVKVIKETSDEPFEICVHSAGAALMFSPLTMSCVKGILLEVAYRASVLHNVSMIIEDS